MSEAIRLRLSVFICLALLITPSVSAQQQAPYPGMSNAAADDMAKTYAFYMAQVFTVQSLSQRFPELSAELARAQLKFDSSFKASVDNINAIMTRENTRWESDKPFSLNADRAPQLKATVRLQS